MSEQDFVYHGEPGRAPLKMWTRGVAVEEQAMQQLRNVAALPFIHHHVAAMPDVHWGMGATVGSVIPTLGAIVPAAVGVDIGCGMMAARTALAAGDLPDNLAAIRSAIEAAVPHGRTDNGGAADRGAWGEVPAAIHHALRGEDAAHGCRRQPGPDRQQAPEAGARRQARAASSRHARHRQSFHRGLPR